MLNKIPKRQQLRGRVQALLRKALTFWNDPRRWQLRYFVIAMIFLGNIVIPNLFSIEVAEAAIAVRGTATTATTGINSALSLAINKPSGVIAGDIMIATVSSSVGNSGMTITSTTAGIAWTARFADGTSTTRTNGTGTGHIYTQTLYRVATSSDVDITSYTFTITVSSGSNQNQRMAGVIMAYSGVNAVDPIMQSTANVQGSAVANFPTASVTPTANNAYIVGGFGVAFAPTLGGCTAVSPSDPDGAGSTGVTGTEQGETCTQDTLNQNVTSEYQDYAQTTAAAVQMQATSSTSARGIAHALALRPATHTYNLSAYRWYININSIDFLGISHDAGLSQGCSGVMDRARSVAQHPSQGWVIMAGFDGCNSEQWHIQKRSTLDGTLMEEFGPNGTGIITHNGPTTGSDRSTAVARDNAGNVYIGGFETATSGPLNEVNTRWRIEKRNWTNGQLVTGFGNNGVVTSDLGTGSGKNDYLRGLYVDTTNGYLYAAGEDSSPTLDGTGWRIEKRNLTTGALCVDGVSCLIGGFGTNGAVTTNPTANGDSPVTVAVDEGSGGSNSYLYVGGYYSPGSSDKGWRVEKRNAISGNLCTSTGNCPEGAFGFDGTNTNSTGIYQHNPNSEGNSNDDINAIELEIKGGNKSLYIGGNDKSAAGNSCTSGGGSGKNQQWRMEKINAYTGGRDTTFNSTGIVQHNPDCNDDDTITSFSVDTVNDFVFIVGTDGGGGTAAGAAVDYKWRVQKRKSTSGALCIDATVCNKKFGGIGGDPDGSATSNPVDGSCATCSGNANIDHDQPLDMIIDVPGDSLYIVGFDRGASADGSTGDTQWRLEKRNLGDGTRQFAMGVLANQDKPARPFRVNMQVRLRLLLHVAPASIYPTDSPPSFKLQYSPRSGTCDPTFIGEETSYQDIVSSSGDLQWLDNTSAADGAVPRDLSTDDPVHAGHSNAIQTYEEANPFTINSAITGGNDGLWDFALKDQESFGGFCVRVVRDDGTPAGELLTVAGGGYTVIPEIDFCMYPTTDKLIRHGSYFCGQRENAFYWSLEDL